MPYQLLVFWRLLSMLYGDLASYICFPTWRRFIVQAAGLYNHTWSHQLGQAHLPGVQLPGYVIGDRKATISIWFYYITWWRHQMETFSVLLPHCERNSLQSFDVFFDLHLNKQLSKQSRGLWFETPSHPLWCHCNENTGIQNLSLISQLWN